MLDFDLLLQYDFRVIEAIELIFNVWHKIFLNQTIYQGISNG